jgi:Bacterial membrane protein YfhO
LPSSPRLAILASAVAWGVSAALLIAQPLLFYAGVLFNPRKHIPFDIEGFHLPVAAYIARCVREGVLPLWDPYSYCGVPIHADIQAQLFYPVTWIAVLLGNLSTGHRLFYWIEWLVPMHMILAGLFTFVLSRHLRLSFAPALFGATVYQLGGYFASQAQHLGAICCGAWLPLVLLCVSKLHTRPTVRWIAILAVAAALVTLSGFPAVAAVVFGATAMLTLAWSFCTRAKWKFAAAVLCGLIVGQGLAAIQLIPTYQLANLSVASDRAQAEGTGGGLRLQSLPSLVVPNYYHIFTPWDPAKFTLQINFTFLYIYCGLLTVVLLLLAPFLRRTPHARLFFGLTFLSAIWMLGDETPVYRMLYTHLPHLVRGSLYAAYALMAFCVFAALTSAVVLNRIGRSAPGWLLWAVVLFTSADLLHFGSGRPMNSYPGSHKGANSEYEVAGYPGSLAHIQALVANSTPPPRVDYLARDMFPGIMGAGMLKIPTADGDNPFALKRIIALRRLFCAGRWWERQLPVKHPGSPIVDMLNIGFLAAPSGESLETFGLKPLPLALETAGVRFYQHPHALPRFFLVRRLQVTESADESFAYLGRPDFNPSEEAVVEANNLHLNQPLHGGEVRVERYEANRVELRAIASGPAFLASSEVLYPGWRATINGKRTRLYMTNGAFRGIFLNQGVNRIVLTYWCEYLTGGILISALSALLIVASLVLHGAPRANSSTERFYAASRHA